MLIQQVDRTNDICLWSTKYIRAVIGRLDRGRLPQNRPKYHHQCTHVAFVHRSMSLIISPSCSDNKAIVGCGAVRKFPLWPENQPIANSRHSNSSHAEHDVGPRKSCYASDVLAASRASGFALTFRSILAPDDS